MDVDEVTRADRCAGIAGDFLDAVEDGEDARLCLGQRLGDGFPRPGFQDVGGRIPFGGDLADVPAHRLEDLQAPDLAGEDRGRSFGDLLGVAGGECGQAEFPGLGVEFVDRVEADGDQDRVAGERFFRAGHGLPFVVQAGDRHGFDGVCPVGAEDRVRGVDRDAEPLELVLVDFVAAAFGQGFDEPGHRDPGLEGVVPGDQADVAAADDEQAAGRADEVAVDQGLEGAGAVNAGQGVPGEGQGFFPGARCHQEHLGIDLDVALSVLEDADFLVAEDGQGRALQPDLDAGIGAELVFQLGRDVDAPGPGEDRVIGAEEPVSLEDELAAEAVLVVDEEGGDAALAELDGGREAGRSAADDQHGDARSPRWASTGPTPTRAAGREARPRARASGPV